MSTALYRRYRPESFADVIGQEHVTEPLMQALRSERVNHAYLFSGPRGCGKTTSARILARCLNCEQGPTPEPCGTCDSCVALARDGAGSVDVIEIDAASHGRVDDTRELRERAAFGPAQSRFKVYIIDEAHMVSREGFNSLLKIVEEPPPHVKFIFATTEPEKVLATIRSRTHHYPFHLVPPQRLSAYLEQLCEQEGVRLEPGVLSFVTRAGGGSVRDSLSVLDQLIAGAGEQGLTYERTAALLGFTDVELLDAVVEAVAAGDAATLFAQLDRVMESGHDPRRFVEDLLERYRDLIVLTAVGEQAGGLLPGLPEDQVERMRRQGASYGAAGLSRAADLVSRGLSEMTGAVSYRLMLELLAARLLLPAAAGEEGYGARLDRIERRLGAGAGAGAASAGEQGGGPALAGRSPRERASAEVQAASPQPQPQRQPQAQPTGQAPEPGTQQASEASAQPEAPEAPGHLDTAALRRQWPEIIAAVRAISRRTAGALESMQVVDFDGRRLLVGMPDERWIRHFMGTSNEEALRQGVIDALALDTRIEATVVGGGESGGGGSGGGHGGPPPAGPGGPQGGQQQDHRQPPQQPVASPVRERQPDAARRETAAPAEPPARPADAEEPPPAEPPPEEPPDDDHGPEPQPPTVRTAVPTQTEVSAAVPDRPQRGRLRTRGGSDSAVNAPPTPAAPVRVRGRGGRGDTGADAPSAADRGLAEQLGTGMAAASGRAEQPDWSQRAASGSAPAWATGTADVADTGAGPGAQPGRAVTGPASAPAGSTGGAPGAASGEGDAPSADDEDLATSGAVGQPVIETVLGGTVIAINDDPVV